MERTQCAQGCKLRSPVGPGPAQLPPSREPETSARPPGRGALGRCGAPAARWWVLRGCGVRAAAAPARGWVLGRGGGGGGPGARARPVLGVGAGEPPARGAPGCASDGGSVGLACATAWRRAPLMMGPHPAREISLPRCPPPGPPSTPGRARSKRFLKGRCEPPREPSHRALPSAPGLSHAPTTAPRPTTPALTHRDSPRACRSAPRSGLFCHGGVYRVLSAKDTRRCSEGHRPMGGLAGRRCCGHAHRGPRAPACAAAGGGRGGAVRLRQGGGLCQGAGGGGHRGRKQGRGPRRRVGAQAAAAVGEKFEGKGRGRAARRRRGRGRAGVHCMWGAVLEGCQRERGAERERAPACGSAKPGPCRGPRRFACAPKGAASSARAPPAVRGAGRKPETVRGSGRAGGGRSQYAEGSPCRRRCGPARRAHGAGGHGSGRRGGRGGRHARARLGRRRAAGGGPGVLGVRLEWAGALRGPGHGLARQSGGEAR
jgi:hypothetical protein